MTRFRESDVSDSPTRLRRVNLRGTNIFEGNTDGNAFARASGVVYHRSRA